MRRLSLLSGLFLLGLAGGALAAPSCPANGRADPKVEVVLRPAAVSYRNDLKQAELTALFAQQRRVNYGASRKSVTAGLTRAVSGHEVSVQTQIYTLRQNGLYCGWLSRVTVTLYFESMIVNVAGEYRPGSCEYTAVIDHENKHVAIYRRNMDIYSREIKRQLEAAVRRYGPAFGSSRQEVSRQFMANASTIIKPLLSSMNDQSEREHARLDSPQSYQSTQNLCNGWRF